MSTMESIFFGVIFILGLIWFEERSKRKSLQELFFRLNQKIDLVKKAKPEHYVPTRHHNIAGIMLEKTSSYQDCVDYEQLEIAIREGEASSERPSKLA